MLKRMRFLMIGVVFYFAATKAEAHPQDICWGGTIQRYVVGCTFYGNGFPDQCLGADDQRFDDNGRPFGFEELRNFGYSIRYTVSARESTSTVVITGHYPNRQKMVINFFFNCDNEDAPYLMNMGGNVSSGVYLRGKTKSHTSCTMSKDVCPTYLGDGADDGEAGVGSHQELSPRSSVAEKVIQMLLQEQEQE